PQSQPFHLQVAQLQITSLVEIVSGGIANSDQCYTEFLFNCGPIHSPRHALKARDGWHWCADLKKADQQAEEHDTADLDHVGLSKAC
ncbi:MAG TPA: hypothetical protein QF626_06830, partial [Prochlorococcaceae cyanobacterium Fu_MAG_50]|nr:hypothetical protein [Prochlorococcaceae cyanobacterium Fu_MAG_50]